MREQSGPNLESRRSEMKEKEEGDHSDWVSEISVSLARSRSAGSRSSFPIDSDIDASLTRHPMRRPRPGSSCCGRAGSAAGPE